MSVLRDYMWCVQLCNVTAILVLRVFTVFSGVRGCCDVCVVGDSLCYCDVDGVAPVATCGLLYLIMVRPCDDLVVL